MLSRTVFYGAATTEVDPNGVCELVWRRGDVSEDSLGGAIASSTGVELRVIELGLSSMAVPKSDSSD